MKRCFTFLFVVLFANLTFGQTPAITEILMPECIQGVGSGTTARVPFVCRLTITGLQPDSTYRYYHKFVLATSLPSSNGEGNPIFIKQTGEFQRVTNVSLSGTNPNTNTLKADGSGNYTGWFAAESVPSALFTPGNLVYLRIVLNNGSTGISPVHRPTAPSPIRVINFGAGNTLTEGTALRSTLTTGVTAKNFVLLYDTVGARPVAGTFIEADETDNSSTNGYADFYAANVNGVDKTWGTIIPNNLAAGIRKISQYSLTSGNEISHKLSSSGYWPVVGGDTVSTANATGGQSNVIVLDGAIARLDGANVKSDQTLTFNDIAKTYGDGDFDAGAVSSARLPVFYSSDNTSVASIVPANNLVHIVGAGTANIKAEQFGNDFYNPAIAETRSLTVNKAVLTIKPDNHQIVQGAAIPALTVSYSGFISGENESVLTTPPTVTTTATSTSPADTYEIVAKDAVAANYTIQYQPGFLTIVSSKQPQSITFGAIPAKMYGDPDFNLNATASSGLTVKYRSSNTAVADTLNGKIHIVGAGITTITAYQEGDAGWLAATDVQQQLTIDPAPLTVTADNKKRKVGQPEPKFTVKYNGFVLGEDSSDLLALPVLSTDADINSGAGVYTIFVAGAASNNYNIRYEFGELTVEAKISQQITFNGLAVKKYGDVAFTLNATASSGLPVTYTSSNNSVATVSGNQVTIVGTGTTTITAAQAGNDTIAAAISLSNTLIVQKANLTIQANDLTKTEGQPNPSLTVTYSGFVYNENAGNLNSQPVLATTATEASVPGKYTITVQGATATNYNIIQLNGALTVLPPSGDAQESMLAYCSSPGQLQVNVFAVNAGKGAVQLFDHNGTRLVNLNVSLNKGYNIFRVPVGKLTPGIYHVRAAVGQVMLKTKVIIQ
jgi:hypothetical protein